MSLRTVKVKRLEILDKVRANREDHAKKYQEALIGYKALLQQYLLNELQRIEDTEENEMVILNHNDLPNAPENHTKDYDKYIAMLDWETSNIVELTDEEFGKIILDQWHWKSEFTRGYHSFSGIDVKRMKSSMYTMGAVTPKKMEKPIAGAILK